MIRNVCGNSAREAEIRFVFRTVHSGRSGGALVPSKGSLVPSSKSGTSSPARSRPATITPALVLKKPQTLIKKTFRLAKGLFSNQKTRLNEAKEQVFPSATVGNDSTDAPSEASSGFRASLLNWWNRPSPRFLAEEKQKEEHHKRESEAFTADSQATASAQTVIPSASPSLPQAPLPPLTLYSFNSKAPCPPSHLKLPGQDRVRRDDYSASPEKSTQPAFQNDLDNGTCHAYPRLRFVKLPYETTTTWLYQHLRRFRLAQVPSAVQLVYQPNGRFSGQAYAYFESVSVAQAARRRLNTTLYDDFRYFRVLPDFQEKPRARIERYPFHIMNRQKLPLKHGNYG